MLYRGETVNNVYSTGTQWLNYLMPLVLKLLADFCPVCVCCPYSTAPVVPPRPRLPAWAAGPTACLPTPGPHQSATYDLCHCATPPPSAAPTSSLLRARCALRSTAHPTLPCIVSAHSGWRKPRSSR